MTSFDVFEFKFKKLMERLKVTDLSEILIVPKEDEVEIYRKDILVGVLK